jgi:hypothetical protein
MDCKTARLLLCFARPGELEPGDAHSLQHHLAECPECGPLAQAERDADARLGQAIRDVPVPVGLRKRLDDRLRSDRRRWYRRRVVSTLAAAAAVLVAIGLGLSVMAGQREAIDVESLCTDAAGLRMAQPEFVERWFADRGVAVHVPREFNYVLLTSCGLDQVQNTRHVPRLLFECPQGELWVYVLSGRQFNLKASPDQRFESGGYTVQVWRPNPEDPDVAYLLVYTGGRLEPFLKLEQPAG